MSSSTLACDAWPGRPRRRPAGGARPRAGRAPRRPTPTWPRSSTASKPPGRRATSRHGSRCGSSRAPEQRRGGGDAARGVRLRRGRLHLPAASHAAAGRRRASWPRSRFHRHRAQGARALLDPARRAARGGMGGRVAAGGEPDGRPRPPGARAAGLSRARLRAALQGLRAAPRGRHAVLDPRRVGPTLATFVGRARVRFTPAPAAEREQLRQFGGTTRSIAWWTGPSCACTPWTSCGSRASASSSPSPPGHAPRAGGEGLREPRRSAASSIDAPLPRSPWWLMPGVGDAVVDFP